MTTYRSSLVFLLLAAAACSDPVTDPPSPGPTGGSAGTTGGGGAGMGGTAGSAAGAGGATSGGSAGAAGLSGQAGTAGSGGSAGAAAGTAGSAGFTLTATFDGVATYMQQNCGLPKCHGGAPDGPDLIFVDRSTLYNILTTRKVMPCGDRLIVSPGKPEESAILMLPNWECTDFVMPQGCIEDPCLPEADLATIRAWIAAGAPQ
ncbi:MAG TPA: hypothetical protein VGK73_28720 [Polyangiaceae bacterium]